MPLITELYAFIATEAPGEEGITATQMGQGGQTVFMPLIGADATRVAALRERAQMVADASGLTITLARFTVREDVEQLTPQRTLQ